MLKVMGTTVLFFSLLLSAGCAKKIPQVDLSSVDPAIVQRCTEAVGVMVGLDERFHEYWNRAYDSTVYNVLGGPMTPVKRRVLKILSAKGIENASKFTVIHYREKFPDVEVKVWMEDGTPRPVNVAKKETVALADWPCEMFFPRRTTYHISTLAVGDTVEIKIPLSGPDKLMWHFGSHEFCMMKSHAAFGHSTDTERPDLHAVVVDASGGVVKTSEGDAYPMEFELQKPLMPISKARLPFVLTAFRCPGWSNLRGQLFQTAVWMARNGSIDGKGRVNPILLKPIENNEIKARLLTMSNWLNQHYKLEKPDVPRWMRWMPLEPASELAGKRKGASGSVAVMAFRILEEIGLKPRFALLHTNGKTPFAEDLPTLTQFDKLAVVIEDENGTTHWIVPGMPHNPEEQPPAKLKGRKALVLERYWIDREQGAGKCKPVDTTGFSCQMTTPEPVEVKLVTIGG